MIEKVNPSHPDKIADRIAGAIVDMAYTMEENPKISLEVLVGHGRCMIMAESSVNISSAKVELIVNRIAKEEVDTEFICVKQDKHLANNQKKGFRCGDNGIFKGVPLTEEHRWISKMARATYDLIPFDGKYIYDIKNGKLIICQSNKDSEYLKKLYPNAIVNPLGDWTGGINVDSGALNRKLGSDMADGITGGGLHGKDLSKADVSINIYAFLKAQLTGKVTELSCAIGDKTVDGKPYCEIVEIAREFIKNKGGFEKFAEWGLF